MTRLALRLAGRVTLPFFPQRPLSFHPPPQLSPFLTLPLPPLFLLLSSFSPLLLFFSSPLLFLLSSSFLSSCLYVRMCVCNSFLCVCLSDLCVLLLHIDSSITTKNNKNYQKKKQKKSVMVMLVKLISHIFSSK